MKILLIVPTFHYKQNYPHFLSVSDFPQGYAYLAASLKKAGHEVVGLNLNNITGFQTAYDMLVNKISKALEEVKPDLIGIGGLCIDYSFIKDAMQVIRMLSKVPVVLGGGIINNDAEFIFNLLKPDYAIVGEAEEAIVQLANGEPHESINNLGYWKDGKAVFTKLNYDYGDINSRSFPDYEPFGIKEMLDKYSMATRLLYRYSRTHPRPMIISTARSCPFDCSFCVHSYGAKYRARSIENIMEEIKQLYENYKFNILIIQDELFAVNKHRMRDFCSALIENKKTYGWDFDWMFQTHANARLDFEVMVLARNSGCFMFSYGLESASPLVLKSMNKKTKVPQIIEAIKIAREAGIGFSGNLIFGDPAETEGTIRESVEFYHKYCQQECVFLGFVMPYPGSQVFDYCLTKGIIKDKLNYYEHIDDVIFNMTSMPDQTWYNWVNFLITLEQNWFWQKSVPTSHYEKEIDFGNGDRDAIASFYDAPVYKIWADCPFCGQEMLHRQIWKLDSSDGNHFLGTCCPHCNGRVRVDIKQEVKVDG